jgi:hypothetical protein
MKFLAIIVASLALVSCSSGTEAAKPDICTTSLRSGEAMSASAIKDCGSDRIMADKIVVSESCGSVTWFTVQDDSDVFLFRQGVPAIQLPAGTEFSFPDKTPDC